jgi:hypothetical protein
MSSLLRLQTIRAGLAVAKRSVALHPAPMSASYSSKNETKTKAVIFDMGGVLIPSPLPFFLGKFIYLIRSSICMQ